MFLLRLFCDVHCCSSPSLITRPPCLLEQGTAARATADSGIRSRCDRRLLIHILCRVNRQPTSDGRRATAVQLPLRAGRQQAARTDLPEILVRQQWSYVRERLVSPTPSRPDLLAQLGMSLGEASSFKVRCVGKFAYNKSETAAPAQRKSVD